MELTVLGAGPAYTDRLGATGAAYLIQNGVTTVLFDLGQGSFPRLMASIEPSRLDAIVISHLHPDHFVDLVSLRHYLRYQFVPPRRVPILGPAGLAARIDSLHDQPGFAAEALDISALSEGTRRIGELEIEARLVTHTTESYGFRVVPAGGGPGLVYSGDCGNARDLQPLIRPADTLLAEVSFGPGPVPEGAQHLDGPAVGDLAASAAAGTVFLTHLQMGFDPDATLGSVRNRFDGDVQFVWPGDRRTI